MAERRRRAQKDPPASLAAIERDLLSKEWDLRERAILNAGRLLRTRRSKELAGQVAALFEEAANDPSPEVRSAVARSLLHLYDERFATLAERLRQDAYPHVAGYAEETLRRRLQVESATKVESAEAERVKEELRKLAGRVPARLLTEAHELVRAGFALVARQVGHDLDNAVEALGHCLTDLSLALDGHAPDPALFRELLGAALAHRERIRKIGQNLRDFVRPRPERVTREPLRELVEEALALVLHRARPGVLLLDQVEPDMTVVVPRDRIVDALTNLLGNALDATCEGSVTIEARLLPENEDLELLVTDTGCGIHPDSLPSLFQLGFTTKQSLGEGEHMGWGLYVARRFVEDHSGGKLRIESEWGRGTTARVVLPCQGRSLSEEEESEAAP